MNIEPQAIQQKSMEVLTHLVDQIGPRPAGSDGEKRAFDWLEEQFHNARLETLRLPVRYQPEPVFFPYYSIAALGFAVAGLTMAVSGWVTLLLPLLILLLPEGTMWLQSMILPCKDGSSNLLVLPADTHPKQVDVILCAHVDTARAIPDGFSLWKSWRDKSIYTMMRVANILIIPGILQFMGMDIGGLLLTLGQSLAFGMAVILLVQDIWEALASRERYSPGANDNGSGVSLLASMALALSKNPPAGFTPGFLFTGAEECGLHGARQFAAYMQENNIKVPVISVDMVGAGSGMRITTQCGTLRPVKADEKLNELIKRADPYAVYHAIPRRWGDFVPFAQAGIPAAHLENMGTKQSWAEYHTPNDTMDGIDPEMMQYMSEVLTQLLWILEKDKGNPVK